MPDVEPFTVGKKLPSALVIFSSAISYMLPVVAIFIGMLDGETFPPSNLVWVVIIIAGVFLMNRPIKKKDGISPQNNVKVA